MVLSTRRGKRSPFAHHPVAKRRRGVACCKRSGGGFAWYNEVQEAACLSQLGLVSDRLVTSPLQMWLQPKFSLNTGRAVRAAALVRWHDPQSSVAVAHALRELGVHLSINDFGTGYFSLACLQQLPVSELKINRSFIDRVNALPGTQGLVKTMIDMGHGMGLVVTAEGVETEAEKETITRLGRVVRQGYLGSRLLHGSALQSWFDNLAPVEYASEAIN